ncbi:MAG: hypothetical protein RJB66_2692 [Pseudomonadota bacterium]|jgi:hypothetical protein
MKKTILKSLVIGAIALAGCEPKRAHYFSILADSNIYAQNVVYEPRKIDVLWIIDNSGSMETSQINLANNFQSFIQSFQKNNFDFHIGVGATDAWKNLFDDTLDFSRLRDGVDTNEHSGSFVLDKNTPNLVNTFTINAKLGTRGTGDERAFQSFKATLLDPANAGFRRPDAFLAIIVVSDEDDFSHSSRTFNNNNYNDPELEPVQKYVEFLDEYTQRPTADTPANYSVSTITVTDLACQNQLNQDGFVRYPGVRYMELANKTGGKIGSLCAPFSDTLSMISDSIASYSTVFALTRKPIVETIRVSVDSKVVPNDEANGWTYRPSDNSILFHGNYIPAAGANIVIDFDPIGVKI